MVANNLLNLYTLVLVPLFSEWMYEWELCHLDSAVVNCMLREKFLDVLTRCSVANLNVRNECYYSKFEWIALRKLGVRNIDVWKHKVQSSVDASVLLRTKRLESVSDVSINKHELFRLIQLCPVIHSLTLSQASYSMLRAIVDKIQCLQSLYIEYVSDIPEGASLHFGPHLTSITMHCVDGSALLRDNPGLTSVGLLTQYAPSQVGRLHRLDLKSCYPDNEPPLIEWNHPYDLQSLFLSNINISDDYLIQLAHRCPALTCLVASASSSITDTGLVELAKCCPSLTRLDIGSTLIADHSLLVLASSCTRLKQLNVSKAKEVTDVGVMAVVRDCTQLSQLRIKQSSHSRRFKNILTMRPSLTYLEAYSLTSLLSTVHNMEYLHVTLYSVKMSSLWMRSERTNLVSLKRFDELQLCGVVQRCPGLLELSIDEYLDESVLIAALMHCPLLTALRLAHSVSDAGVRAIAASGVRLKRIEIHKSILDDSVLTPFVASQPELRKLALIRCSSYTDDTLYAVAQHCSRLASVELIYNREVTDGGVIHLLRGCSLLRSLNVSLCSLITVNVLNVIAELGRDMTLVDVSCTRVLKESSKFFLSKIGKVVGYVD